LDSRDKGTGWSGGGIEGERRGSLGSGEELFGFASGGGKNGCCAGGCRVAFGKGGSGKCGGTRIRNLLSGGHGAIAGSGFDGNRTAGEGVCRRNQEGRSRSGSPDDPTGERAV